MAPRSSSQAKVVVKKATHLEHEAGHGGSWKVAYADFVTAMMAFFLLLWLLAMLEPDKRDRLADFFVEYSLLQVLKGQPGFADSTRPKATSPSGQPGVLGEPRHFAIALGKEARPEDIRSRLAAAIEARLADVKDQVLLDLDDKGVRIEIVDKEGRPLFARSSSEPTETAKRVLKVMAETLGGLDNKLTITGHTDAVPFASQSRLTNWELSSFRALAARREMETWGLDAGHLALVAGAADSQPLVSQDPGDPRNRRISIRVLDAQAAGLPGAGGPGLPAPGEAGAMIQSPPEAGRGLPALPPTRTMPGLGESGAPGRDGR
ncbi:MAG: OmpA family protein [Desulfarculus sp.]|nr:OmpA family protein [Desulfarculus sp.]